MYKKILFLISLIFILTGCGVKNKIETQNADIILTSQQEKNINIETQKAGVTKLDVSLVVPAQFKANIFLTNRIYAPVDGKIVDVFVVTGQTIKKGQPLVKIQSDIIGQIESELLQNIIQLTAQIKMSQSQLEFFIHNYSRENMLYKEHITSKVDWESSKTQMNKERANLSALKIERSSLISVYQRRLSMYGADSQVIQRVIATNKIYPFIVIKADKNGVVLKRDVNREEFVMANKELMSTADLSKIWLVGNLFEKDIHSVRMGDKVSAKIDDFNVVEGNISYIAPALNLETKTLEVIAEIKNTDYKIKPNMFTEMNIKIGTAEVLAVPSIAIQKIGDKSIVYVRTSPHTYAERIVKTGIFNDKYIEIKSGIKEGEIVATRGSFSLLGESIKKIEADN